MSTQDRYACFATTISGLGHLLAAEAEALGLQPRAVGNDGRDDVVAFRRARWSTVSRLRIAERIFVHIANAAIGSTARSTVGRLSVDEVTAALLAVGEIERQRRRRVRLVVRLRDERRFTRRALREALARRLGPIVTTKEGATIAELWVLQDGPTRLRVGLRVASLGTMGRPPRVVERPGALRPAVPAAMIRLVEEPGVVLDPCCGTGTIAVEAAAAGRRAVAGDLDAGAVAAAVANGVASATRLDARRLPFASNGLAAVVTNLPFGRQHVVQGAPVAWYRRALTEALRVASQAVVLAAPTQPFRQALGRVNARLTGQYPLELLGNRTTIWVLHRPEASYRARISTPKPPRTPGPGCLPGSESAQDHPARERRPSLGAWKRFPWPGTSCVQRTWLMPATSRRCP